MLIYIDSRSGVPIYDQICQRFKELIISGELKSDEILPSIRSLAKELRISVITTKRAYEELEREGYVYTVPGKGCFVSGNNAELMREENLKKIEEQIGQIVSLARSCNLTKEELIGMIVTEMEEKL
ncbi:MAG: GntR family transcriptional regulator [Clostridia bacterium]|nr:GntR family transcriptional regulator [Clostridia bacterium]